MKEYIVSLRYVKPNDKTFSGNMRRNNNPVTQQAANANSLPATIEKICKSREILKKYANLVNNRRMKCYFYNLERNKVRIASLESRSLLLRGSTRVYIFIYIFCFTFNYSNN